MSKMKAQYSGHRSKRIWDKVNKLKGSKHELCYTAFVGLQDYEQAVLRLFENCIRKVSH